MHELDGNYLRIYKKNKLIASGRVVSVKTNRGVSQKQQNNLFISFDSKIFFNGRGRDIRVEKCSFAETFVDTTIKLRKIYWRYINIHCRFFSVDSLDAVIESTKDELDPEVIPLVRALNSCSGIRTIGSCSGHKKQSPWVNCRCEESFNTTFLTLYRIIQDNFNKKIIICNDPVNVDRDSFLITTPGSRGKEAWEAFDELALHLSSIA